LAVFPVAVTPLWQLLQVPGVTLLWSNTAGVQALLVWQLSQVLPDAMCDAGFPVAILPL
jgi:hypothetical protein